MKRVYQEGEQREHAKRRAQDELKAKHRRRNKGHRSAQSGGPIVGAIGNAALPQYVKVHQKEPRPRPQPQSAFPAVDITRPSAASAPTVARIPKREKTLRVPTVFSFVENVEENLELFSQMERLIKKRAIYLDMSSVVRITPDALLYALARFRQFDIKGIEAEVRGNVPLAPKATTLLNRSGWYDYVEADGFKGEFSREVLRIKSGSDARVEVAAACWDFAAEHLPGDLAPGASGPTYGTYLELMLNTKHHAYTVQERELAQWYTMAAYDCDEKTVTFVFLDTGVGIPYTVAKRSLREHFQRVGNRLRLFSGKFVKEEKILLSAMRGEQRTRTREPNRGNGLASIREYAKLGAFEHVVVVSGRGLVNCVTDTCRDCNGQFEGTLFSWKVKSDLPQGAVR